MDYVKTWRGRAGRDLETLCSLVEDVFQTLERDCNQTPAVCGRTRRPLAALLGVPLEKDRRLLLRRFYASATRESRLYAAYRENDGSLTRDEGTLFS